MRVVSLLICIGVIAQWSGAQFLNNRPYPTYSLESMPDTDFTCRDKVLGGYYADPETQCQMFHICVKVAGVGVQDFRFLCPNGTAFDQDHQICADWDDVDCDATTLYYSSDNFDLYRIGSGFESKAVKYGEEEETFALQRAETGDARINHEHQVQRVNQQKQHELGQRKKTNYQYNDNSEKDIFKGSSSSNFFNNRNGGKEIDDEEDDKNVNHNQDRDQEQKRKVNRQQNRKPQDSNQNTPRPNRPTGFLNNFAGSSFTASPKPQTTTVAPSTEQPQRVVRVRGRQRQNYDRQYSNADNFRQNNGRNYDNEQNDKQNNYNQGTFTISTPAPFKQSQFSNNNQYISSTTTPRQSTNANENYPSSFPQQKQTKQTENYPSTFTQGRSIFTSTTATQQKSTSTQKETENYPSPFTKKQTGSYPTTPLDTYDTTKIKQTQTYQLPNSQKSNASTKQLDNYPTTFSPKASKQTSFENYPSTFSPRTNSAFNQISQQTTLQRQQFSQTSQQAFSQNSQQYNSQSTQFRSPPITTSKPSPFTQYTPTVPKVTSTTPVTRSNRFDETQYDDGSYNSKYDNYDNRDSNDEFLKTAQSTNIASSRNELAKNAKAGSTTAKPYYESPRPFSLSTNTPKITEIPKSTANINTNTQNSSISTKPGKSTVARNEKKDKNASYDYAYYDSNPQSDPEYEIDTDFKKSTVKEQ